MTSTLGMGQSQPTKQEKNRKNRGRKNKKKQKTQVLVVGSISQGQPFYPFWGSRIFDQPLAGQEPEPARKAYERMMSEMSQVSDSPLGLAVQFVSENGWRVKCCGTSRVALFVVRSQPGCLPLQLQLKVLGGSRYTGVVSSYFIGFGCYCGVFSVCCCWRGQRTNCILTYLSSGSFLMRDVT